MDSSCRAVFVVGVAMKGAVGNIVTVDADLAVAPGVVDVIALG